MNRVADRFSGGLATPHPTEYTIAAWLKPGDLTYWQTITVRSAGAPLSSYSHELQQYGPQYWQAYTWDGATHYVYGTTPPSLTTWHHVATSCKNGDYLRLYVNGKEEGVKNAVGTLWNGGNDYWFGAATGMTQYFDGYAAEWAIWSKQLTADQIAALAVKRIGIPWTIEQASLILYCPMHDAADGVTKTTAWAESVGSVTQSLGGNKAVGKRFPTW
jgi:hypothetical protein